MGVRQRKIICFFRFENKKTLFQSTKDVINYRTEFDYIYSYPTYSARIIFFILIMPFELVSLTIYNPSERLLKSSISALP